MAITKEKKQELFNSYVEKLKGATNVVVISQNAIGVSKSTDIRRNVRNEDWEFQVVKKRIFKLALKDIGYEDVDVDLLKGSVVALYSYWEDEYAPLKAINKFKKEFDADKTADSTFEYLGAWFDKKWQWAEYISELANIPSKDELLSKLAWLFNYPLQSFTWALNQIAEQKSANWDEVWETKTEKEEPKSEEKKEETITEETEKTTD